MLQDKVAIWRFNRGDPGALRSIYQKYKLDLLRLAMALSNDISIAEDLVNDTFVTFAQSMGSFELTGSLKSYLATCLANRARNMNRQNQRRRTVSIDQAAGCHSTEHCPDQSAVFSEEYQRLTAAMTELPYEQREVIILHRQNSMRLSQIAKSQGVSVNTVKSRYRYGLEKLRSLLNEEHQK